MSANTKHNRMNHTKRLLKKLKEQKPEMLWSLSDQKKKLIRTKRLTEEKIDGYVETLSTSQRISKQLSRKSNRPGSREQRGDFMPPPFFPQGSRTNDSDYKVDA